MTIAFDCLYVIVLHLFSGSIPKSEGITFDIKSELNPTICDDIRNIRDDKAVFKKIDLVIPDPPYQKSDFEKYNCEPFDKRKVLADLAEIMTADSFLTWLDIRPPIYRKL